MLKKFFNHLEETVIGLLLSAMTLIYFSNVIARYVFNTGWVWVLELTTYLFAWLVLFGASYGVRIGSHIGVDLLVRHFSPLWQRITGIFVALLGIGYGLLVLIGGWDYVSLIYQMEFESEDLPIKQWVPYSILPIGAALLIFRFSQVIYRLARNEHPHLIADEAAEAIKEYQEHQHGTAERGS